MQFVNAYALIIGVDQNQIPRLALPTVAKDAQAVYDVLTHPQRCGYAPENVRLLSGEEATGRNILDGLYWLQEQVGADPEATVVVYYSGHGMVDTRADQYYLIPYDIGGLGRVRIDGIKAESFTAQLDDLRPRRLLVVLDCCHAAGLDAKELDLSEEDGRLARRSFPLSDLSATKSIPSFDPDAKNLAALSEGDGRAVLNSSTGPQSSYIRRDGRMSIFTYHLIEALTGHAPYDAGDATVLVTDVMSYVTRRVAETAAAEGREQTPVMRTTGVFPVALILGGEGVAKGMAPPDPLDELPPVGPTFNQRGQTVHGPQINPAGDAHIGHIGDTVTKTGGVHFERIEGSNLSFAGDVVGRDKVTTNTDTGGGDAVAGDKHEGDQYNIGSVSGGAVAIGRGAQASQSNVRSGLSEAELARLFTSLRQAVVRSTPPEQRPAAVDKVAALQAEVAKEEQADDSKMAGLVQDIAELAPGAIEGLVDLFANAAVTRLTGPTTSFVVGRLQR